ncbi:MAG: toll/interleukin-1 receptor domain-containing protein [Ferruginibacter sp.]
MDEPTINRISDPVIKEKCILILGPNVSLAGNETTINQLLKKEIENYFPENVIKNYFSDDEFFQFYDDDDENTALGLFSEFFKKIEPSEIQKKITEIPFHVIISTSPDRLLVDLFKKKNYDYTYAFYSQKGENKDVEKPGRKKPLIYNLFGDVDKTESIVYTYDQLFDYLEAVFSKQDLPPTLKNILNDESNYILFIGFRFEKWYFKLLLRLLKLYKIKSKYGSGRDPNIQAGLLRNFYTEEFKVKFIDFDETTIIDAIYGKCKELGILRSKSASVIADSPAIYISYAWGGEKEQVVDELYTTLKEKAYNLIRDKQDLGYKGDIRKFMDLIGTGAYIIVVISDKYLKSKNCMYEMQSIYKNKDIQKRIFPIVMKDAKIYNPLTRADYNIFWQNEKAALQKKYNEIEDKSYTGELLNDLNNYDDFRRIIDEITKMFSDMNTLTPAIHEGNNFSELMNALDQQMKEDKSK